ncbi:heterokaryon incompatibility protein-domain-containing protein [Lasiosphaeria miniovina]|uniref:Heterokaryon incompatibility protein-domain-containing protein n=1 Tax=Lasiosphaeria miniovina TaxID=1954250 RepID=A0AA40E4X5_9PEZI|nr:heterokaryon incompatibility protein-domain-containing protein [Lasiosphaeria miniovina]KAK0722643.1 heterokaryon incompatibility protein-domain-containing protein [Lasiosphaeria miniovina]
MRLLEFKDGEFYLTKDYIHGVPEYAILSHTWGADTEEVTFQDLVDGTSGHQLGWKKIKFCADQARRDGLRYFWVDSCCINKSDNNELSRAINSMFRWYQNATRCYVYLSGISSAGLVGSQRLDIVQEPAFRSHRWFNRGWTLQELVAPPSVEFFTQDGLRLGDKGTLEQDIYQITGIAVSALRGAALSEFSVEERFKWAENRQTTHEEDWAYCLLGIFGVFMPLIYGEGKAHAVRRLKKEIFDAANQADTAPHSQASEPKMSSGPRTVAAISSDGLRVHRWDGRQWAPIGNATTTLYGGGFTLLGINPASNDVSTWAKGSNWIKLGGPGAKFVVTAISVYGITPDYGAVYKWNNDGTDWKRIGGPARDLLGGGYNALFGISPDGGDIYHWISNDRWEKVGGPGAEFAVDGQGQLYGITPEKDAVNKWTGTGQNWTKLGGPASRIFAGGLGVFALDPSGSEIWRYTGVGEAWEKVGGPGVDFAVTDDGLFGLDSAGEIWKWESGQIWTNLGAPRSRQIVASA